MTVGVISLVITSAAGSWALRRAKHWTDRRRTAAWRAAAAGMGLFDGPARTAHV